MAGESLLAAFLRHQGFAVFEYIGDGVFHPMCQPAGFCQDIFGEHMAAVESVRLADTMPFLDDFLTDAEQFWASSTEGSIESGAWIGKGMSGRDIALEASALWLAGKRILFLRNPQEQYDEQVELLQKARNGLLEHDRLLREVQKKEILLHCIIHDLAQPLTAMRGCFSALALGQLPPNLEELVDIGQRQTEKQEAMIREILEAFSAELTAQQGFHTDAEHAPDLAACAMEVVRDFSAAFAEHGARIEVDPHLDLSREWRVVGDASRLRRIYANLVENALRFTPSGSAVTLRVDEEGRFLRACVDDQGPGLPQGESAARLFGLFSKGKAGGGKAGLGLYFCRITVERWGGTIGCEPRPEGGSRFWFCLPRAEATSPPHGVPAAAPSPSAPSTPTAPSPQAAHSVGPSQGMQDAEQVPVAEQAAAIETLPVSSGKAVDEAVLLERVGHDRKLLGALVEIFRDDAPKMLAQLGAALDQRDPTALQTAAEALRRSLENHAARPAARSARRLEELGREGRVADAAEVLVTLEKQVEEVKQALAACASQG